MSGWRGVRVKRVAQGLLDDLSEAASREPVKGSREELVYSDLACEVESVMAYSGGKVRRWVEDTRCSLGRA